MRRILLFVAMLLLATAPAMATVTVRAIQHQPNNALGQYTVAGRDCRALDINYTCDAGEEVRAFALDVTLDNGMYFTAVTDYNRGDNNGYGIFPGSFRVNLNPTDINWSEPNYGPIASQNDPDGAGTGLGTGTVRLEMGSLYVGAPPSSSGTLCRLWVDINSTCPPKDCNLGLAVNALRGGVVDPNGNTITPTLVARGKVAAGKFSFDKRFPCWQPYTTQYNEWLSIWEPGCWAGQCWSTAWPYQCLGDADNKTETLSKYRCYTSDYTKLMACWAKKATLLRAGMGADGNALCADFDHKYETLSKYRCYTSDYSKMMLCWAKKETALRQYNPPCPQP